MALESKVALVTGANSILGSSIASYLVPQGYKIALHGRCKGKVEAIRDDLGCQNSLAFAADLNDEDQTVELVDRVINEFGRIDLVVNNAAVKHNLNFFETDVQVFHETFNTNVLAPILITQRAVEYMNPNQEEREKVSGYIINISSNAGWHASNSNSLVYGLSKNSLSDFTTHSYFDLKKLGIVPISINLGYTRSGMSDLDWDHEKEKRIVETTKGRINETEDVSKLILEIINGNPRYGSGPVYYLLGGQVRNCSFSQRTILL